MSAWTLDEVTIDTTGWVLHRDSEVDRIWFDEHRNPVRLMLADRPCAELTIEGWRARGAQETAAGGGALLSFDEVRLDGCQAFRGLFKYPAARCVRDWPEGSLAVYAVGMIVVPLGGWHLRINTEAVERGSTGLREALIGVKESRAKPSARSADAKPGTIAGYFDVVRGRLGSELRTDAEEFDEFAPQHPLSRVRALQRHVLASARLSPTLKRAALRVV